MTMDANTVIKDWPEDARTVTAALITKYGPADEVTPLWLSEGEALTRSLMEDA